VRAGVPAGGQFAPSRRPEATGIELSEDPGPAGQGLPATAVLAEATRWGTAYARRYGAEAPEVIGEVAVVFYEQRARRRVAGKAMLSDAAYLNSLARSIALQAVGADRSYVRQAWRTYQARCDEAMQALGRELRSAEEDEIAASVIAAQPPRRRAPADFHRPRRPVSLETAAIGHGHGETGRSIAASLAGAGDTEEAALGHDTPLGPIAETAEQLAQHGDHAAARRLAWDALAELAGAPPAKVASVTERQAAAARRAVRRAGGAGVLGEAYARGLAGPEQAEALFAPFGAISGAERDAVAGVLTARRHLADELWDLALRAATSKRGGSDV
jgi:hypothetical protein